MHAIFRCDASATIGGGHVMRCIALALKLKQAGWNCRFAFRAPTLETIPNVRNMGFDLFTLEGSDRIEHREIQQRWKSGCDLLVVDHYHRSQGFETACRDFAKNILVIDDLGDRAHNCDMLLDQNLGKTPIDYHNRVPEGCQLYLGPKYALLRAAFAEMRSSALTRRKNREPIERILVSFGAGNFDNAAELALKAINRVDPSLSIDFVFGNAAECQRELKEITDCMSRVTTHRNVADMASLMTKADIAFGAPGITAWERCCLGLPTIQMILAENQEQNAREMERRKAALNLGWCSGISEETVQNALRNLLKNPEATLLLSRNSANLCDGRGTLRLCMQLVRTVTGKGRKEVQLRFADESDMNLIHEWQTEPGTRRYARNPQVPTLDEHKAWFESKLKNPRCFIMIILYQGEPSGVLRLDGISGYKTYEVSIYVTSRKHHLGIGKAALILGRSLWSDCEFQAEVVEGNAASHNLFQSAGYKRLSRKAYVSHPRNRAMDPNA